VADVDKIVHQWLKLPHSLYVGSDYSQSNAPDLTIIFIHGLANSHMMWGSVLGNLVVPSARIITVDLLGFGNSPKPQWQVYSAVTQAKALRATLVRKRVKTPVLLVGHSLGSLVAVEYASMFPEHIKGLLLCSPPFYKPPKIRQRKLSKPQADDLFRMMYKHTRSRPELYKKIAAAITRAKLINPSFVISDETLPAIISSLEMSIENQTAQADLLRLSVPTIILYGRVDPFVVKKNIKAIDESAPHVTIKSVLSGHEVAGSKAYTRVVISSVLSMAANITKK